MADSGPEHDVRVALAEYLEQGALWREEMGERHPEDLRNLRSAEAMRRLADYIRSLSAGDERLQALHVLNPLEDVWALSGEETRHFTSRIGFHGPPSNDPAELDELLSRLLEAVVSDEVDIDAAE